MALKLTIGTSGYAYAPWKGKFYPSDLPTKGMLAYYATHFPTVEINSTFYRLPVERTLDAWAAQVPPTFEFAFKVPGAVTHRRWSASTPDTLAAFLAVTQRLGQRLGPLLFQFPPYLKKDLGLLEKILNLLPSNARAAFEFRNTTWFDDETLAFLRVHALPLVYNDADLEGVPFTTTASWGYLRLRRTAYSDTELRVIAQNVATQPWKNAYVFFKHEDTATGPALGARLRALASAD